MDKGLFMFLFFFWITAQILCNIADGNAMVTNTNVSDLEGLASSSVTTSTDTAGTPATYVAMGGDFFDTIGKLAFFDYSLFRNTDGTANDFVVFRYMLITIGIIGLITAAITFRSIIAG